MNSNAIFAAVAVAFVIFITMRGELRRYMGLLIGQGAAPSADGGSASAGSTLGNLASSLVGGGNLPDLTAGLTGG